MCRDVLYVALAACLACSVSAEQLDLRLSGGAFCRAAPSLDPNVRQACAVQGCHAEGVASWRSAASRPAGSCLAGPSASATHRVRCPLAPLAWHTCLPPNLNCLLTPILVRADLRCRLQEARGLPLPRRSDPRRVLLQDTNATCFQTLSVATTTCQQNLADVAHCCDSFRLVTDDCWAAVQGLLGADAEYAATMCAGGRRLEGWLQLRRSLPGGGLRPLLHRAALASVAARTPSCLAPARAETHLPRAAAPPAPPRAASGFGSSVA